MGDIISIFSNIGSIYSKNEKKIKNKSYEYEQIKTYLCDIETKKIDFSLNIPKDELIVCRFGVGSNSGNLFPNQPFIAKVVKDDIDKFIKGVIKSKNNFLTYFSKDEIEKNEILKTLSIIEKNFFTELEETIKNLEEYEQKGSKVATYFALSYKDKPISAYFEKIYEKHIHKKEKSTTYGYDIMTNEKGVGADANLPFCSVNELPASFKKIKPRLLPLNSKSANNIKNGFRVVNTMFSYNFFGFKMAIMPIVLSSDKSILERVLHILETTNKDSMQEIGYTEYSIHYCLEQIAKNEQDLPVLNTIIFYGQKNSAVDLFLQIDDVLPSYISYIADKMSEYRIKAYKNKDVKDAKDIIYVQNLFGSYLEIMDFLLSQKKVDKDLIIDKYAHLIYKGSMNEKYSSLVKWGNYFANYYKERCIESLQRYQNLFNSINVLQENFILKKELDVEEVKKIKDEKEKILYLYRKSEFIQDNVVLQASYLLGMISAALINWQLGINKGRGSSYENWLNNSGAITKDSLEHIWKKSDETIRKLHLTSGKKNKTISCIKELLVEVLPKTFLYENVVKSSYITLGFAMGGSDFIKYIKKEKE